MERSLTKIIISFSIMLIITTLLVFYARGYRINVPEGSLEKTGMIVAKSIPDSAKVYLNGKLTTATNNTIAALKPGKYSLRIVKEGFIPWEKEVEVFEELVTDITAVLVSQAPRLEPLTNTGVSGPALFSNGNKIAYFLSDVEKPGIYVLNLSGNTPINIFRSSNRILIPDTKKVAYSQGEKIIFSPDDTQAIVQMNPEGYYLFNIEAGSLAEPKIFSDIKDITQKWRESILEKRIKFLEKEELSDNLKGIALDPDTIWAPDGKKFLYKTETEDGYVEYKVHNLEDPLPVGERRSYVTLRVKKGEEPLNIIWYPDSFHLILVDPLDNRGDESNQGTISLIRIDGTNKTEIYSGVINKYQIFSSPGGDKIIILASFKQNTPLDLYAISIR